MTTPAKTLSVSLAEELERENLLVNSMAKNYAAKLIQRRVEPLERENERLREALRQIEKAWMNADPYYTVVDISRKALARIKEGR